MADREEIGFSVERTKGRQCEKSMPDEKRKAVGLVWVVVLCLDCLTENPNISESGHPQL